MTSPAFTLQRAWARQATIGFLGATTPAAWSTFLAAFEQRLRELGWIDGGNLVFVYHWAEGRQDRYAKFARDLVARKVDVIVTSGTLAVRAAKAATKTIPIVFASAGDPVRSKLVASIKHPGGNVTGLANDQAKLGLRRLAELRKVVPDLQRLAIIGNRSNPFAKLEMDRVAKKARGLKFDVVTHNTRKMADLAPAFKRMKDDADALYVCTDPLITTHQIAINTAAAIAGLPTMHAFRTYVETGGLMSFGPDFGEMFRRAADLVDKILRGKAPAALSVKHTASELVINLNTAKALGLKIPKGVRKRAKTIR